jgi:hypothetical protein
MKKKNKAAQELGRKGGITTKALKGPNYYKELSEKGVAARRLKALQNKV